MIDFSCLPGIFINVEHTLGIDMTLTFFQGRGHFPYTVQLITSQILIDMARLDDIGVLQICTLQFVRVIWNVNFLLAFQFPVVTIRCTVKHIKVIRSTQTISRSTWTVISNLWRTTNATLTSVIYPSFTWLFYLVQCFVNQQNVTRQTCRRQYILLEVEQHILI